VHHGKSPDEGLKGLQSDEESWDLVQSLDNWLQARFAAQGFIEHLGPSRSGFNSTI